MSAPPPPLFDQRLQAMRMRRAARRGTFAAFLRDRAAEDAVDRLLTILRHFSVAVETPNHDGALKNAISRAAGFKSIGTLIEFDTTGAFASSASSMLCKGELERLPFADESVDLVVSLLALHWTNDLVGVLVQFRRMLRPDGLFLGTLFTGQTLTELRQCLLEAEAEVTGGAAPRVSPFADGPDLAMLATRAGLALPVVDIDRVTVRYAHPLELLRDLRAMGETNALMAKDRRPLRRDVLMRAMALYQARFSEADGRVRATFEMSTLTGWAPHPDQQKPLRPGQARTRLADALGVTEHKLSGDLPD